MSSSCSAHTTSINFSILSSFGDLASLCSFFFSLFCVVFLFFRSCHSYLSHVVISKCSIPNEAISYYSFFPISKLNTLNARRSNIQNALQYFQFSCFIVILSFFMNFLFLLLLLSSNTIDDGNISVVLSIYRILVETTTTKILCTKLINCDNYFCKKESHFLCRKITFMHFQ